LFDELQESLMQKGDIMARIADGREHAAEMAE